MSSLRVVSTSMHLMKLRTRMPFRYGIATVTEPSHLFVRVEFDIDGVRQMGLAADHLAPKWFSKDPDTSYEEDVTELLTAIKAACGFAEAAGAAPSVFELWKRAYDTSPRFSRVPLIHSFATSFIERAAIDAFCRATGQCFADALRRNTLGIHLGDIHPELARAAPADFLPGEPLRKIIVRHTVGMSDPLTDDDLHDGLPQSLRACVETYSLTHFKIKLAGDAERDLARLRGIAAVIPHPVAFTLDGNENFRDLAHFREFWGRFIADPSLESFHKALLFVEQPLHRDAALSAPLRDWSERPRMIIDESDDQLGSAAHALRAGYAGTSYKSCKGVFKGIANACLMKHRGAIISAEDLSTIGPVSLLQDLAVIASLGIAHAERNGHHYFRGLSAFPMLLQQQVLAAHRDLYEEMTFATLRIRDGAVSVDSVIDAPFGYSSDVDVTSVFAGSRPSSADQTG